jgi:hypothetical protein
MKNFQPDLILFGIVVVFLMAIGGGMFLKGLSHWWILLMIAFVLVAIYAEQRAKEDAEEAFSSFMRSDYYGSYESDDIDLYSYEDTEKSLDEVGIITKCSQCGNKVYEICMCKPVKRQKKQ